MGLHTLIGINGTIATELLLTLRANRENVRLVSSRPFFLEGVEYKAADIHNYEQLVQALAGSTVVYLLAVFPFNTESISSYWLPVMYNVINASKETSAKLIYLDQTCVYGELAGIVTENTRYRPCCTAGQTSMEMVQVLENEMHEGTIKAAIGRTTDFFGPGSPGNSKINKLVFEHLQMNKNARWLVNADTFRTFAYFPDIAKALYILGCNKSANGKLWHLPVATPAISGRQFIQLAAQFMQGPPKPRVLSSWYLKSLKSFSRLIRGLHANSCQENNSFVFSSFKFENTFGVLPTPYHSSIKATADWYLHQENRLIDSTIANASND